jgi:hypothetical protein
MARIYVGIYAKYIVIFMVFMALHPVPVKAEELTGATVEAKWAAPCSIGTMLPLNVAMVSSVHRKAS